jgi:catechol 2,3-dioxygenase-like lactoylglutathione lyase family enzyme
LFDHVTIRIADRGASEAFYRTVLSTLGIEPTASTAEFTEWGDFSLAEGAPVTRRLHVAFVAPSRAHVDAFWQAGVDAGHRDDGAPGPRPEYGPDYYGGFLLDPDGNSAEAVHHDTPRSGHIDHLWLRVADLPAVRRFYVLIAPHAGLRIGDDQPDRVQFLAGGASFSFVAGEPTEHVHLAFPAPDEATVDAFHRAATGAGHPDNGPPGERPHYHPGYYGAFVLDPAGHNVEVVCHHRPVK